MMAVSGNVEIPGLLAVHKLSTIGNGDQIEVHAECVNLAGG